MDDVVEILREVNFEDKHSIILWRRVIAALRKSFEHDQEGKNAPRNRKASDSND